MPNECKGCKSNNDIKTKGPCNACNIPRLSNKVECPCLTCLVKAICVTVCKDYRVYADRVYEYYGADICKDIKKRRRYEIKRPM